MADGSVKKKAKDHGDICGGNCIPGCAGGMGGRAPPEEVTAVADEIVLKLKQGDKDFRHFTQGFTVTRMPPPPPKTEKGEPEKKPGEDHISELSQAPAPPLSPEKCGTGWGEADEEQYTPVKKRERIPKEWRGLPPRSAMLECSGTNPNQKRDEILERWKKPIDEKMLGDFWELGYKRKEQMQEAITEEFTARREITPEKAWRPHPGWEDKGGFPMQDAGTYSPTTLLDERKGEKKAQFVEWQYNSAWFRWAQAGPDLLMDEAGRKIIRIFFQPRGNHNCRSMLFTDCWTCWSMPCGTCYYMYQMGARRWGPGACDQCPSLTKFETTKRNFCFEARYGTTQEDGWSKESAIKWVLVYDWRHELTVKTYVPTGSEYAPFEDISDEEGGAPPYIPEDQQQDAQKQTGMPTEPAQPKPDRRKTRSYTSSQSSSEAGAAPLLPGDAETTEEEFEVVNRFKDVDIHGKREDQEEEILSQEAAAGIIEDHPFFRKMLEDFQTQGLIPRDGTYDDQGLPTGEWTGTLCWNGLIEQEEEEERLLSLGSLRLQDISPLGSSDGRTQEDEGDPEGVRDMDLGVLQAGAGQLTRHPMEDCQRQQEMESAERKGHAQQDVREMDQEAKSGGTLEKQTTESHIRETGTLPRDPRRMDGEGEPSSRAPRLGDLPVENGPTRGKSASKKTEARKRRAKAIKAARNAFMPKPDTHYQVFGGSSGAPKRKRRAATPHPVRRSEGGERADQPKGYYTEEYSKKRKEQEPGQL